MGKATLSIQSIDFTKYWHALRDDMLKILFHPLSVEHRPKYSWERLHQFIYRICTGRCYHLGIDEHQRIDGEKLTFSCPENNSPQPKLLYFVVRKSIERYMRDHLCSCCDDDNTDDNGNNGDTADTNDSSDQKTKSSTVSSQHTGVHIVHMGMDLLKFYVNHWDNYSIGIDSLNGIFLYMTRDWIIPNQTKYVEGSADLENGVYSIRVLGYLLFRQVFYEKIQSNLQNTVIELIHQNRELGDQFDEYDLLERYVRSVSRLGFDGLEWYEAVFEQHFLKETEEYYKIKCAAVSSVSEYLNTMLHHLRLEEKISGRYLLSSTKPKLMSICINHMIHKNSDMLFAVLPDWLKYDNRSDLKNFYALMKHSNEASVKLRNYFHEHVRESTEDRLEIVRRESPDIWKNTVDTLINVYLHFTGLIEQVFDRDTELILARDGALKSVILRTKNFPEWLAKKMNAILRGSEKLLNEEENEIQLNTILKLYTLLTSGDAFLKFYSVYFGKRLIQGVYSHDNEAAMLGKLKQICSFGEVYKLQRMFNDIHISEDLNNRFNAHISNTQATSSIDFSCTILTLGSWPLLETNVKCMVPRSLEPMMNQFAEYYISQHQGRKLQWVPSVSKGIVRSNCWASPYEFQVSWLQLCVLYHFNEMDQCTVEELQRVTDMDNTSLHQTLHTFYSAKVLIIQREGAPLLDDKKLLFQSSDIVSLNFGFSNKRLRISLFALATKGLSDETHSKVVQQIDDDRKYVIQAIIVRIMKSRKSMNHRELVGMVLSQLQHFRPSVTDVKKNIEHLIEMDYLARHVTHSEIYNYVA